MPPTQDPGRLLCGFRWLAGGHLMITMTQKLFGRLMGPQTRTDQRPRSICTPYREETSADKPPAQTCRHPSQIALVFSTDPPFASTAPSSPPARLILFSGPLACRTSDSEAAQIAAAPWFSRHTALKSIAFQTCRHPSQHEPRAVTHPCRSDRRTPRHTGRPALPENTSKPGSIFRLLGI